MNVGLPAERNLPILNGIQYQGKSGYYKNAFGEVTFVFSIVGSTTDGLGDIDLALLPEGFRPPYDVYFPVAGYKNNGTRIAGFGVVKTNGIIHLSNTTSDSVMHRAIATLTFLVVA